MLKKILIILALLASVYSAFFVAPFSAWRGSENKQNKGIGLQVNLAKPQAKLRVEAVVIKTKTGSVVIQAEIADTKSSQIMGLMHRKTMYDDEGMLFVYEQMQDITMWMQNTILPLDMVFISKQGRISHIAYSAQPFSLDIISSNGQAKAVLEINAGIADKLKLKVGDVVRHTAFD